MKKRMNTEKRFRYICLTILLLFTAICITPFLLMMAASVTEEQALIREGYKFWPSAFSFDTYKYLWAKRETIFSAYMISILVTFAGTVINVIITSLFGYPLSRKDFKWRNVFAFVVFFTMLFNGGLVPTYLMYVNYFHIKNTLWALVIPNLLLSANNVLMIRSYYMTSIPDALFEAAKIDGAGHLRIFLSLVLPLGKPILVTMGLFSGLAYWNDWTNGLYYLSGNAGQKLYSIQNLLNQMITDIQYLASGKVAGNIGAEVAKLPATSIRMAIAFIAMLPLFIIYPFLQKYFAEGITLGAVKG